MTEKKKKRDTIEDVAKDAGVSIATVSRIINNKDIVNGDTREKVLSAIEKLGFVPRSVPVRQDIDRRLILVCMPDFENPFYARVIRGIRKAARFHEYDLFFMQADDFYTRAAVHLRTIKNSGASGVLMVSPISKKALSELNSICPVVMCSEYIDDPGFSYVSIDNVMSAKKAVEYLISTGCRRIGLLNSFSRNAYARDREQGFDEALQDAGLDISEDRKAHISAINYQSAFSKAAYLLSMESRPDAIFAAADVFAVAAINAAKKLGLRVPDDVSVIGFDNIEASLMCDPQLTTVDQPAEEIGYQSCELLIERLLGEDIIPRHIRLETEIIVRQSTKLNK